MKAIITNLCFLISVISYCQHSSTVPSYWNLSNDQAIIWRVDDQSVLPHSDHIEMSGKNVSAIINYEVDSEGNLTIVKDIIFPQLRTYNKSNEPDWKKYRAYFRRTVGPSYIPTLSTDEKVIVPTKVDSITINGWLKFFQKPVEGLQLTRWLYPSMDDHLFVEEWTIKNVGETKQSIEIGDVHYKQAEQGYKGRYTFTVESDGDSSVTLQVGESYSFSIYHFATIGSATDQIDLEQARASRQEYLKTCQTQLILTTPDSVLNQLFYFSKIRAAESIFESSMGLIHSPGGGNYYLGTWANDQVEYSGPFFPYFNYDVGHIAAFNTYKKFSENIPNDTGHIAYAFEVDGNFPMTHLDRGDAAMIAYGTTQYLLASGDVEQAKQLWPLVEWSLDYCHRKRNAAGAVQSESDEMEGRISTGTANLSTSSLYFGGLKYAQIIASTLGLPKKAEVYERRRLEMENVIDNYFGANLEGLNTYRYFAENEQLRHWICLPLVMGLDQRAEGTLAALFDKLWTDNGILVEYNPEVPVKEAVFWDRATLYALRGAMKIGEVELALEKLRAYSQKRLLGDHVPYAVEAYPENGMRHLSAESALYCRIFIEGLLGIEPSGFSSVTIDPKLPKGWDHLTLENVLLCGRLVDIELQRQSNSIRLRVAYGEQNIYSESLTPGQPTQINFD